MSDTLNPDQVTPEQVFERMPAYFQPDKAGNTTATYQFDLSGDGGGQYWLKVAGGQATSGKGAAESPTVTLSADARDYVSIAMGTMDPTVAFMQGKLKIKGDMGAAMKMQSLFKRPD